MADRPAQEAALATMGLQVTLHMRRMAEAFCGWADGASRVAAARTRGNVLVIVAQGELADCIEALLLAETLIEAVQRDHANHLDRTVPADYVRTAKSEAATSAVPQPHKELGS